MNRTGPRGGVSGMVRGRFSGGVERLFKPEGHRLTRQDGITVDDDRRQADQSVVPVEALVGTCLLYTSPSPRDATLSRMPSSA